MWFLIETVTNILQGLIMTVFMKRRLSIHHRTLLPEAVSTAAAAVYLSVYEQLPFYAPDSAVFIIPLIYGLTGKETKWPFTVYWTIILGIVFNTVSSLSINLFLSIPGISAETIMSSTGYRLILMEGNNCVLAALLYMITKIRISYSAVRWNTMLLSVLLAAGWMVAGEVIYRVQAASLIANNDLSFSAAYICVLASAALSFALLIQITRSAEQENQYRLELETLIRTKQHNEEIQQTYRRLQILRHDFKHHVQIMEQMLNDSENENAVHYITEYKKHLDADSSVITGSDAVDALIASKRAVMDQHRIAFSYSSYPLDELPINEVDFCTVLGNILDNAIEGTARISDPSAAGPVRLIFSRSWNMFYILCDNSCNPDTLLSEHGSWRSSKADISMHSLGIQSIRRLTDNYGGHCSFDAQKDTFHVKIALPFPDAPEKTR